MRVRVVVGAQASIEMKPTVACYGRLFRGRTGCRCDSGVGVCRRAASLSSSSCSNFRECESTRVRVNMPRNLRSIAGDGPDCVRGGAESCSCGSGFIVFIEYFGVTGTVSPGPGVGSRGRGRAGRSSLPRNQIFGDAIGRPLPQFESYTADIRLRFGFIRLERRGGGNCPGNCVSLPGSCRLRSWWDGVRVPLSMRGRGMRRRTITNEWSSPTVGAIVMDFLWLPS